MNLALFVTVSGVALTAIGLILEIIGAVIMSRSFVAWPRREVPLNLIKAAFVKRIAEAAAEEGRKLVVKRPTLTVQGLSLIFIGFLLQFSGAVTAFTGAVLQSVSGS
ncbi:MAG: hypothetical protein AAF936_14140 [Pseudomonadota bacterium]